VRTPTLVLVAALSLASAGCEERSVSAGTPAPADAGAAPVSAPVVGAPRAPKPAQPAQSASSAPADKAPLQVLKIVFTSDVKSKEPVDKLDHAEPGQRVWVHLTLRNRGEDARPITVTFRVKEDVRSKVDLKVDPSWSYRTWAYNTMRASDTSGDLFVDVRDEAGAIVASQSIPIRKP
jgi:hypothetical protein